MKQNSNSINSKTDEMNFEDIITKIIDSRKLIIILTLSISILGFIYSLLKDPQYESSALVEIGAKSSMNLNQLAVNNELLIENSETLIQELLIKFLYKQTILGIIPINLKIESIQDRLLAISYISASPLSSENVLIEILEYINERHSNLLNNNFQKITSQLNKKIKTTDIEIQSLEEFNNSEKERITNLMENTTNQIDYLRTLSIRLNNSEKERIVNLMENATNQIKILSLQAENLYKVIEEDSANLILLQSNPLLLIQRTAVSPTLNQIIYDYKNQLINIESEKTLLNKELKDAITEKKILENNDFNSKEILKASAEKNELEGKLNILEKNALKSIKYLTLVQKKQDLKNELELLIKEDFNITQIIGEVQNQVIEISKTKITFLSFIFGLLFSLCLVIFNNTIQTVRSKNTIK